MQSDDYLGNQIILGSASWGSDYGVFNSSETDTRQVKKILALARANGINGVDTAPSYGRSQELIGASQIPDLSLYSKVSQNFGIFDSDASTIELGKSMTELKASTLSGLMFHSAQSLVGNPSQARDFMGNLVSEGKINKWGVSVYTTQELERVLDFCRPDFVQLPMNLADQRFLTSGMLSELQNQNIEVHVRSIFLQGLLLQDPNSLPERFKSMSDWLEGVREISNELNITVHELAILSVLTNPLVDHAVVGVNSTSQLGEIIRAIGLSRIHLNLTEIPGLLDEQIIDPRKWTW